MVFEERPAVESKKILLVSCLRLVRTRESELVTADVSLRKNNIHPLNGGLPITIKIGITTLPQPT